MSNFQRPAAQPSPFDTQAFQPLQEPSTEPVDTPPALAYVALLEQSLINQREILTWQQRTAVEMREWNNRKRIDIKIQDANIPFWNLVMLMLKVAFAAIPALIIFGICILIFNVTMLGGILGAFR